MAKSILLFSTAILVEMLVHSQTLPNGRICCRRSATFAQARSGFGDVARPSLQAANVYVRQVFSHYSRMSGAQPTQQGQQNRDRFSGLQVASIVLVAVIATVVVIFWVIPVYLFPDAYRPVRLDEDEQQVLYIKLERIGYSVSRQHVGESGDVMTPEPYSEVDASREISLSERELNALIAGNTDLGTRLVIDLADDLASAKMLIPMDPDFPVIGGKTIRVHAGLELAYADGQPSVVLKGISVMGIPIPNAWLGNLKNVDLVQQFNSDSGFWRVFADGVGQIRVSDGQLWIKLQE